MSVAGDPLPLLFDVHPGREIVRQGEPYPDAWVIRRGALLMETIDVEGHRLVLDVLGPGDLVGGPAGWTADASIRALVTSGLFAAGPVALRDGLARRASQDARLDDLAERFGRAAPGGRRLELPLTQEHLAGLTGATRESVNRALGELAGRGCIERTRGCYVVRIGARGAALPVGLQHRKGA